MLKLFITKSNARKALTLQNSIVLITDDKKVSQSVEKKILLLRSNDSFKSIEQNDCFEIIKLSPPVLVIYHLKTDDDSTISAIESEKFLNFLQKLKQTKSLKSVSVLLLYEEIDENTLCSAFEKGLTDFIDIKSTDTEFTIRTIWCLQKQEKFAESEKKNNILSQLKIIDSKSNTYTENYTYTVLKEESNNYWGTFAAVSPDVNTRSKISLQTLMNIIKKVVRSCDILGFASDFKIYLWFRETEKENVARILEKINFSLSTNYTISAGYIETKNIDFDKAEELANKALSKALLRGNTFICAKEPKKSEIDVNVNVKNYKMQKERFVRRIEAIISPLFYQMQKRYEEKFFETQITQSVNKKYSEFSLENQKGKGTLTIGYSGYTKINIEIIHDIFDDELKTEKIFVDTEDFTEPKIEYYLEKFIKDFKKYTAC